METIVKISTSNGLIIDPGLCRCCRSIKKCRILTAEYTWMEQKEVYSDMIMDCFGILLSHTDDNERESGVCATCVVRLRDAAAFRSQVLQCEQLFLQAKHHYKDDQHIEVMQKKEDIELKTEPVDTSSVAGDDDMHSLGYTMDDHMDAATEAMSPKREEGDAPPPPPPPPPPSDDDDDLPLIVKARKKGTRNGHIVKHKKKAKTESRRRKEEKRGGAIEKKKEPTDRDLEYMAEENLLTIIDNSYVVPFKNRRNNYYCYYCKDYYPKPEDLREHTVTHDTKPFQLLMGYKKMPKLDVTRVDCRLCPAKIDDIEAFKRHVDTVHGKKIYHEAPSDLLLYRLTWNDLKCVMCGDVFEDFNTLNAHMVEHFGRFTCDVCGLCFLEKARLDAHLKRHRDAGTHTCELCGKTFRSNHYKDMHVDIVHRRKAIIRCPRCDDTFMSYALKNKHLTDAHGQRRLYPCNLCDKVYSRQKTLTEHQRRNHQKVLRHQCEYCSQRFYLPSRLREHVATHTGERSFRCSHCDKSYPRLKSLQYHVRTHSSEQRYRCHVCGHAFLQPAALGKHVRAQHPDAIESTTAAPPAPPAPAAPPAPPAPAAPPAPPAPAAYF